MANSIKNRNIHSGDKMKSAPSIQPPFEKLLEKEVFYHGLLPRDDVPDVLKEVGDFIVRISEPRAGEARSYILSVMSSQPGDEKYKHYVIQLVGNKFVVDKYSFESIQKMLAHYLNTQEPIREDVKLKRAILRQHWELEHESITIERKLGEGAFGEVSMGLFKTRKGGKPITVAIKQAKLEKMSKEQIKEFMTEARLMRHFNHQNVVRFYGVAVGSEPLYLVMELASNGALDSFLQKNPDLPMTKKNEMILQAAWGIEYLHSKPVIHRDIAARNCLYGEGKVKISDFGLTRSGVFYQMDAGKKVPIRWLSPETLRQQIYTPMSDIWSYGIMCWEIYNNGKEPYPGKTPSEVPAFVLTGLRMTFEESVNQEIQNMITSKCWAENQADRLPAAEISQILEKITQIPRPDFQTIAKQIAAEMATTNHLTSKTNKRRKKKSVVLPRGVS